MNLHLELYVLTGAVSQRSLSLEETVAEALRGGATAIQMREEEMNDREQLQAARRLRELAHSFGAWFFINDRPDLAWLSGADGVHLGQDDLPVPEVRRVLGPSAVIGLSVDTVEEAREAERQGADYIGLGPMAPTSTKPDAGPRVSIEDLQRVVQAVSIPVVAVGGIGLDNARQISRAGAGGIAVVSAVVGAPDVREAARALRREVEAGKVPSRGQAGGEEKD